MGFVEEAGVEEVEEEEVKVEVAFGSRIDGGGWKDCGGYIRININTGSVFCTCSLKLRIEKRRNAKSPELTLSKPLPLNALSVVIAMFPPFRCRSHAISRRSSCGNICASCSTCAGFTLSCRDDLADEEEEVEDGEKKYHRRAKKVISRTAISCGILRVCSDIVCARVFIYKCVWLCFTVWLYAMCPQYREDMKPIVVEV